MHPVSITLVLACLLAVGLAGCIDEQEGATALYVRGAPVEEFERLFLTFGDIRVHRAGAEADAHDTDGPGWITISDTPQEYDLLTFTTENARALLANATIPLGRYDQVLLHVTSARGIANESEQEIQIQVVQEELRLVRGYNVTFDATTQITLALALDRSLSKDEAGQYRLEPIIGAAEVDEDGGRLQRTVPDHGVERDARPRDRSTPKPL